MKNNRNKLDNYIHNCESNKVKFEQFKTSLFDVFSYKESIEIYSFYLNEWKSNERESKNCKSFNCYGWKGTRGNEGLNKLEGLLLEKAGIHSFCIMKTNKIDTTLKKMNLCGSICISHPRVVIKMNCKVEYLEDFKYKIIAHETRLECLFRHIRNALAHNNTYYFKNDFLLLEDKENKTITARILLKKETLLEWKNIIESGIKN